jgi:hypothetical protein
MSELSKQQREELKGIAAAIDAVGPLIQQVERLEGELHVLELLYADAKTALDVANENGGSLDDNLWAEMKRQRDAAQQQLTAAEERMVKLQINCLAVRDAHNTYRRTGLESDSEALQTAAARCNTPDLIELPPHLKKQLTAAEERAKRAEEIAGKLPKTKDGVPIVPDMTVFITHGDGCDQRRVIGPYGKLALLVHSPRSGGGSNHHLATDAYSTREAAQAAKGAE